MKNLAQVESNEPWGTLATLEDNPRYLYQRLHLSPSVGMDIATYTRTFGSFYVVGGHADIGICDQRGSYAFQVKTGDTVQFDLLRSFHISSGDLGVILQGVSTEGHGLHIDKRDHLVTKPWGDEHWLQLNDRFCFKRIRITAGTRTSYQYHNKKFETNYIDEGFAEVWFGVDEQGNPIRYEAREHDFFSVPPGIRHRIIAKTDLVLLEASTPEVDDVIRLQDDAGRADGRIEAEHRS